MFDSTECQNARRPNHHTGKQPPSDTDLGFALRCGIVPIVVARAPATRDSRAGHQENPIIRAGTHDDSPFQLRIIRQDHKKSSTIPGLLDYGAVFLPQLIRRQRSANQIWAHWFCIANLSAVIFLPSCGFIR
jgi:hypothetical protein